MDIRDILKSFDQLTEGDSTVHKAGPGGYGNRHGSEDVTDQYGKPIGRASLSKMSDAPAVKRGKGRPPKNADSSGEVKSYDSSELSKAMGMGKAPKPTGKPSVKHSLKEYLDQLDKVLNEADAYTTAPMPGAVAVKDASGKVVATAKNPQAAAAFQKGDITLGGDEQGMAEGEMDEGVLDELSPQLMKRAVKKADTMMNKNYYDDNHNATYDYANQGSRIQHGIDKRAGKPTEYTKADAYIKSEPGANTAKGHRMPVGMEEGDIGKHNNANTGFEALVRKLTPKYGKESAMKIAGAQLKKMSEAEAPQHFAQSSPLSTANRGVLEGKKTVKKDDRAEKDGKKVTKDLEYDMGHKGKDDAKAERAGKKVTKDIEYDDKKKKIKEAVKPDFLDLDKDGNKKEPMKQAAKDKKKVKEGMEHHLQAARLEGKSHALRKMPYNCTHEDMEEARCYHDGYKEGLDECYGQMPILGRTRVGEMGQGPEVDTMASYGADDLGEMDKTSYMKQQAIKTPGGTFKAFGQTMHDSNVLDEFAFEALDKQLNAILEGKEVSEGMTVSISKGQQGAPDSVSVSAQDGEADQLLSIIKSAGMGLFGGEEQGFNAPQGTAGAHGGISVVDDHDGMMALMKKLSGGEMQSGGDYEDEESSEEGHVHGEEGHSHEGSEEPCNECGMMECGCEPSGEEQVVDEVESEDQMAYNVAEDNPPDNGSANSTNATQGNDAANMALAVADKKGPIAEEGEEDTTGEEAGDDEEEKDFFHNPNVPADKQLKAPPKEVNIEESFSNLYKKLALLSEESTEKEDEKAEKAGKKVTKDIEYDDKKDKKEKKLDEWANEAGKNGTDASFEADIDFMTKVISGGLNKQKSTGQTTIPVINGQKNRMGADGLGSPMKESNDLLKDYRKLSGL